MKHFLNLSDLGKEGLLKVLDVADNLKATRGTPEAPQPLRGKQIALVFEKASTRTRLSLEVAVSELGAHPIVLTSTGSQLGRGEPMKDTARVLGRMVHGITLRTSDESRIKTMVEYSGVPVLNALTDQSHPMQLLADLMTVRRHFGQLENLSCAWIGDGNNMASSWIEAAGLLGFQLQLACPQGYEPDPVFLDQARSRGAKILVTTNPQEAVAGAHVISTDVFASMGQEGEAENRLKDFAGFQLNSQLLNHADSKAVVLHCLPAHRGEEIAEDVLEGPQSLVWDEAEARLHTSKSVLLWVFDQLPD
ncbi:MAG: ornithine carbamoyltransferase [Polyangiaceae bacterium]|nr:ornithine carbamoyltransferase [Polyangiaceae bacterium]